MNSLGFLKTIDKFNQHNAKIAFLYLMMISGGIWHILEIFQKTMRILAAPLIIGLTIWICWEIWRNEFQQNGGSDKNLAHKRMMKYLGWSGLVVVGSLLIEWIGVETGQIFGSYRYGSTLSPFIDSVPLAIGFAWLGMLLASMSVTRKYFPNYYHKSFLSAALTALFMTIFDFFMEPAAVRLNYWHWMSETVPLINYISWFLVSFLFSYLANRLKFITKNLPSLPLHAYYAQLIYFVLIYLS